MQKKQFDEVIKKIQEEKDETIFGQYKVSDFTTAQLKKLLELASDSVELCDLTFEKSMGKNEVDIRKLSEENQKQLNFRLLASILTQANCANQTLFDLEKLFILLLDATGMEDIPAALQKLESEQKDKLHNKN